LICFSLLIIGASCLHSRHFKSEWQKFKGTYNKVYGKEEELHRMKVFFNNLKTIKEHNTLYEKGLVTYKMGVNHLADMEAHEYMGMLYNITTPPEAHKEHLFTPKRLLGLPETVDWRSKGAVTPVKNQGQCGSCWSFSATGALEGMNFLKTGKLISLSEQNLVDCASNYNNNGCSGGLTYQAFQYVADNKGIETEEAYPYETEDDTCKFDASKVGATCHGYKIIPQADEHALKEAVATIGPISIAIDAGQDSFRLYSDGVYFDEKCSSITHNHAVLVVGYGTENGNDYWLVKNSWGPSWGIQGYIKMARNRNNQCSVATLASYPIA